MSATAIAPAEEKQGYQGSEKLLWGIVLAVVTFWLFAGSVGAIGSAVVQDLNSGGKEIINTQTMNLAVSITSLFSGLFIVVMGGVADKIGRVKITLLGLVLGVVGSVLLILASGALAIPMILAGRAIQGFSAACIMPASMALVKTYWDGAARQRAVSMWSIGSWGGSGLSALFGGLMAANFGWRTIFIASIVISVVSFVMILGTPESKVEQTSKSKFDAIGLVLFMISILALMIVLIFGKQLGWTSVLTLGLAAIAIVGTTLFVIWEGKQAKPFIDFALFKNTTFTGATISNFVINGTIGLLFVSQQMLQLARTPDQEGYVSPGQAGLMTLGYGIVIIAFIRVGEKLLQKFGPRKPMIWGSLIVAATCLLLTPTWILLSTYKILAIIAYALFGLGLAFYATPSTDAALSNLPADQAGAGAGIYKMASSLGGAIGAAISLAIFSGFIGGGNILGNTLEFQGVQDNVGVRTGGMFVMLFNLLLCVIAILSIVMTVPKGGGSRDLGKVEETVEPTPQLPPDEAKLAILERLSTLSLAELAEVEKQVMLNELGKLPPGILKQLVDDKKQ